MTSISQTNISTALTDLIQAKSRRDNINFTSYKLAKIINVDRSLVQRIINGNVKRPRIDTLIKILQFFVEDGFSITLDDLINWKANVVNVESKVVLDHKPKELPLYQMNNFNGERIGTASVIAPKSSPGTIAILSEKSIPPVFGAGSLFIVDTMKQPCHDNLVAVRLNGPSEVSVCKLLDSGGSNFKLCVLGDDKTIILTEKIRSNIVGVVVRVNMKT